MANDYNIDAVTFRLGVLTKLLETKRDRFSSLRQEYKERGGKDFEVAFYCGAQNACDQIIDDLLYVAENVGDHASEYDAGVRIGW